MALNKKLASALLFGLSSVMAGSVYADIDITVNGASGNVGGTVVVTYDYAALDADDVGGFQFDLLYDPAALTPTDITTCGMNAPGTHTPSCTEPGGAGSGTIRTLIADFAAPTDEIMPLTIPTFGQFTFQIDQAGTHTLTFSNASGADITGGNVVIAGNDASITGTIMGSGYGSTPASGSTINFTGTDVNTAATPEIITVSEIGTADMTVSAATFTGANAADFSTTTAVPFTIMDGGADVMVDVQCTPSGRGDRTATLELTNDSVNDPNPQYTLVCPGLSPNVAANPATVNLAGVIGGTNPTGTFDITNAQDGFTSDATTAVLTESGTAEISITTGLTDGTISVDETDTVTVECDTTTSGMFTETISLTFDDPTAAGGTGQVDVTVNCDIANAFPVYESVPTPGSTIDFGTVPNGGNSAPMGVDVGNSGAVGGADLNVTAAALSGADAAQFNLTFAPFTVPAGQAPDGTDDITVTCDPTASGTFSATLTVNTDDPAEPAGGFTYPLACVGGVDANFTSNPAAGSTVSFGVVPPGSSVDAIITMTNDAASNDDLTIDCALDAATDPEITLVSPTFPQTVVPGASIDVTLNCASSAPNTFTGVLSCTTNDPANPTVTYDLTCIGQPLVVPTLSQWGLLAMALLLMFGGMVAFRLRRE